MQRSCWKGLQCYLKSSQTLWKMLSNFSEGTGGGKLCWKETTFGNASTTSYIEVLLLQSTQAWDFISNKITENCLKLCVSSRHIIYLMQIYLGSTRGRKKPCSATPTLSTNLPQILTGFRNASRNFWDQCTKTGELQLPTITGHLSQFPVTDITPSSTTSTSWRPTWSRPTGRRRSPSSTWLILTGQHSWKWLRQ